MGGTSQKPRRVAAEPRTAARLARLSRLARLLDTQFGIPGTRWRFGLDSLLGLVPGIGDTATAALSGYIVVEARRLGVGKVTLSKMILNIAIDWLVGTIPVVGDVFDFAWKANTRNLRLIEREIHRAAGRRSGRPTTSPAADSN